MKMILLYEMLLNLPCNKNIIVSSCQFLLLRESEKFCLDGQKIGKILEYQIGVEIGEEEIKPR